MAGSVRSHARLPGFGIVFALATVLLTAPAVAGSCSSVSVAPMMFGTALVPGPTGHTATSSTTISVNCTVGTSFAMLINDGLYATGSGLSAVRHLSGNSGTLVYGLWQNSARSIAWGDGVNVGNGAPGSGTGAVKAYVVYTSLVLPAVTAPGTYTDSVALTVSF